MKRNLKKRGLPLNQQKKEVDSVNADQLPVAELKHIVRATSAFEFGPLQIALASGVSWQDGYIRLLELEKEGQVERISYGKWRWK